MDETKGIRELSRALASRKRRIDCTGEHHSIGVQLELTEQAVVGVDGEGVLHNDRSLGGWALPTNADRGGPLLRYLPGPAGTVSTCPTPELFDHHGHHPALIGAHLALDVAVIGQSGIDVNGHGYK